MRKFKVSSIPHLDGLMFMGEKDPRFMNGIHHFDEKSKKNTWTTIFLLTIGFKKGLRKDEPAYLDTLVEVKPDVEIEYYKDLAKLLTKYNDVMSQ